MMTAQEKLQAAQAYAFKHRPAVGGFPFLAECFRQAGVKRNVWSLPSAQSLYMMDDGAVVHQGTPLITGMAPIPVFDETALIAALRADQAGKSTFEEFLSASWKAGVVGYDVDFEARTVNYAGANGECYRESYPAVDIGKLPLER